MMDAKTRELDAVRAALNEGALVTIQLTVVGLDAAEKTIKPYCESLGRSYREQEDETGEYKWLSMMQHPEDKVDLSVFYEEPELI